MHGRRHHGRTLVEMLVAMALGVSVLGGAMFAVAGAGRTARSVDEMARLGDDGQIALATLAAHLRMAGYSVPRQNANASTPVANYTGAPVFACDAGFAANPRDKSLACASGIDSAAVAVYYEADTSNTWPGTAGVPTNCLGNKLATVASSLGDSWSRYALAESRFYIAASPDSGDPTLYCSASSDGTSFAGQPLVANVERLSLLWGVSAGQTDALGHYAYGGDVVRYMTQAQLDAAYPSDATRWNRVSSVSICVLMRSAPNALAEGASAEYTACDGTRVTPADAAQRRVRRAMHMTVHLRNREFAGRDVETSGAGA